MKEILFRKLKPSEAKRYRSLRLESLQQYPDSFGSTYEDQKRREKLAFEKYIEEQTPENFIVGALLEETLVGICGFYQFKDERYRHRGEIIQMYVQAAVQGRQIGYNLLQTTIAEAFKIEILEQIELQVFSHLHPANRIYEKIGFQECGMHERFYQKNGVYFDQRLMVLNR